MAKKKVSRRVSDSEPNSHEVESLDEACQRVQQAREELRQAEQRYAELCDHSPTNDADEPESTIKQLIDDTFRFVRKYPALGVSAAAAVGFFFGRPFRR